MSAGGSRMIRRLVAVSVASVCIGATLGTGGAGAAVAAVGLTGTVTCGAPVGTGTVSPPFR